MVDQPGLDCGSGGGKKINEGHDKELDVLWEHSAAEAVEHGGLPVGLILQCSH